MMSFCDYLGLSNTCSYDVDDVIGRVDRFGFQNFCSPACYIYGVLDRIISLLPLMVMIQQPF